MCSVEMAKSRKSREYHESYESAQQPVRQSKKKAPSAKKRQQTRLIHKWVRYVIQIIFFILAPAVFSGAFSAVKYCFTQMGASAPFELTAFVVLLLVVLGATVLFGRFFCGYACAFGTLGDVLYGVFEFLRSKTPIPRLVFPRPLVRVLSLLKYVVLVLICAACFVGAWQAYSGCSPWVAFAALLAGSLDGVDTVAFVLLGAVALGMIVRERFFCQFLCPLGAIFSLLPVIGCSEFTRVRAHCAKKCGKCIQTCPVDIWPDADTLRHGECIACGRCADVCPLSNVNLVAIERSAARRKRREAEYGVREQRVDRQSQSGNQGSSTRQHLFQSQPLRKTRDAWLLFRGTSVGYTIAKAVVLLLAFWIAGATRYLPTFSDVFGQISWPF